MAKLPHILIADNDEDDRFLLKTAFEKVGHSHNIHLVANGMQAFNYLDSFQDDHHFPSLIVLDLNMPLPNGMEILSRLKKHNRYKKIPVIMFTTSAAESDKSKCLQIGAADFLIKPSAFSQMVSTARFLAEFNVY